MKRILVLSYHFCPSPDVGARRVTELCVSLVRRGCDVTVITASEGESTREPEQFNGISVYRVTPPRQLQCRLGNWKRRIRSLTSTREVTAGEGQGRSIAGISVNEEKPVKWLKRQFHALEWLVDDKKAWSFLVFRMARKMFRGKPFDVVISSGPPMSVHLAALAGSSFLGRRWIMDLRDPWVGNEIWPPYVTSLVREKSEAVLERLCARHADWLVAASPGIAGKLRTRYPFWSRKIRLVMNGFDGALQDCVSSSPGELKMLYTGTLYFNRDPFPLFRAIKRLLHQPWVNPAKISFTLVGKCQSWNGIDIVRWIEEAGLETNIQVFPPVRPEEVAKFIVQANILVNFAQGQPAQIPAKIYEYLASGKEMLLIAEEDSDSATVTRDAGAGRIAPPGDDEALDDILQELYDFYVIRGENYLPDRQRVPQYSRQAQNQKFMDLLFTDEVFP